jgi:hypothetical protein
MGQSQCNEIRAVAALNHPYAFVAWPAGLASRGCQHSVTRGRGQPQLRQHARAEKPAVPAGAEQPPVLSDLRGRCLPDLCGHTVILRRRAASARPRTVEFRCPSTGCHWRYRERSLPREKWAILRGLAGGADAGVAEDRRHAVHSLIAHRHCGFETRRTRSVVIARRQRHHRGAAARRAAIIRSRRELLAESFDIRNTNPQ